MLSLIMDALVIRLDYDASCGEHMGSSFSEICSWDRKLARNLKILSVFSEIVLISFALWLCA